MRFWPARRLRRWLAMTCQSGAWQRLDSLPLPSIDRRYTERATWIPAALECLVFARQLRDRNRIPLVVAVTFSLVPVPFPRGAAFRSLEEFTAELEDSPPALTVFDPDEFAEPDAGDPTVHDVHPGLFGLDPADGWHAELREWRFPGEGGGEYFRSVLLGAPPASADQFLDPARR